MIVTPLCTSFELVSSTDLLLRFSQSGQGYTCVLIEPTLYLREAFEHFVHRLVTSKSSEGLRKKERERETPHMCLFCMSFSPSAHPPSCNHLWRGIKLSPLSEVGWRGTRVIFKLQRLTHSAQGR